MAPLNNPRFAQSARAHITAAKAAPHRAELELTQAENFAKLITDAKLKKQVLDEIAKARKR